MRKWLLLVVVTCCSAVVDEDSYFSCPCLVVCKKIFRLLVRCPCCFEATRVRRHWVCCLWFSFRWLVAFPCSAGGCARWPGGVPQWCACPLSQCSSSELMLCMSHGASCIGCHTQAYSFWHASAGLSTLHTSGALHKRGPSNACPQALGVLSVVLLRAMLDWWLRTLARGSFAVVLLSFARVWFFGVCSVSLCLHPHVVLGGSSFRWLAAFLGSAVGLLLALGRAPLPPSCRVRLHLLLACVLPLLL